MELTVWIVITGDPLNGYTHYGPFMLKEEATKAAEDRLGDVWWVTALESIDDAP